VSFSVTVLGSAAMFATEERACAGYLVETDSTRLWLDAGAGSWRNLLHHVDYRNLDAVVLTHRHPDHTSDVFQSFHARHYGDAESLPPIPLYAPQETVDRICAFSTELDQSYDMRPVEAGGSASIGDLALSFVKMAHPVETLGVRAEADGRSLAYTADTGMEADFDSLARGCDLFVCEATFQDSDEEWEGHLKASQAGAIAARVGASRVVLTHLPANRDMNLSKAEAQSQADGVEVAVANDGLRLELA
jgi:ribonuclease BN (tRNA processing enzyme)